MAPALPVYTKDEIEKMYPQIFNKIEENKENKENKFLKIRRDVPENCKIYQLIQNQCTYDGNKVYCLPFKRVFLRCKDRNKNKEVIGYKLTPLHKNDSHNYDKFKIKGDAEEDLYRDIEITVEGDNDYKIDEGVKEFLKADNILKEKMKEYYERKL